MRKHGFPKIHTEISNIPKFRPIIGTTGTSHCLVDKYLVSLLYPLTTKKFSTNASFDAGNRIQASFFSCAIIIQQTVDLILKQIYQDRVFKHLKNWTLKKTYLKQMYRNCLLSQQHVLPTKG